MAPDWEAGQITALAVDANNDASGDPLFVVTAQANAGLVKVLPGLLDQIRSLVGDCAGHWGLVARRLASRSGL